MFDIRVAFDNQFMANIFLRNKDDQNIHKSEAPKWQERQASALLTI